MVWLVLVWSLSQVVVACWLKLQLYEGWLRLGYPFIRKLTYMAVRLLITSWFLSIGLLECPHNMAVAIPKESDHRERVRWKSYIFQDLTWEATHHCFLLIAVQQWSEVWVGMLKLLGTMLETEYHIQQHRTSEMVKHKKKKKPNKPNYNSIDWTRGYFNNINIPIPKERQCQRMLKLLHNCTHLTC